MNHSLIKSRTEVSPAGVIDIGRLEEFAGRLNEEPKKDWLQKTPDGKADYIPVGIIEMELRKDFMGLVKFNLVSERRELNEYIVVARISVYHPIIGQWLEYDGVGAKVITQKKDTSLNDFAEFKQKNALEMNAPNAYAEAIKNAAKKIGKKYGADVNRKHEDAYESIYTNEAQAEDTLSQIMELYEGKKAGMSREQILAADRIIAGKETNSYDKLLTHLKKQS